MKKSARKILKEKAKFAKKSSGRRESLPPNKVVPDQKKKNSKQSARTHEGENFDPDAGYGGWGNW